MSATFGDFDRESFQDYHKRHRELAWLAEHPKVCLSELRAFAQTEKDWIPTETLGSWKDHWKKTYPMVDIRFENEIIFQEFEEPFEIVRFYEKRVLVTKKNGKT